MIRRKIWSMFLHPQNYFLGKQLIRDQEKMRSIHINQKLEKLKKNIMSLKNKKRLQKNLTIAIKKIYETAFFEN